MAKQSPLDIIFNGVVKQPRKAEGSKEHVEAFTTIVADETWKVVPTKHMGAADLEKKVVYAPATGDPTDRRTRLHELAHVHLSPHENFQARADAEEIPSAFLNAFEDARINGTMMQADETLASILDQGALEIDVAQFKQNIEVYGTMAGLSERDLAIVGAAFQAMTTGLPEADKGRELAEAAGTPVDKLQPILDTLPGASFDDTLDACRRALKLLDDEFAGDSMPDLMPGEGEPGEGELVPDEDGTIEMEGGALTAGDPRFGQLGAGQGVSGKPRTIAEAEALKQTPIAPAGPRPPLPKPQPLPNKEAISNTIKALSPFEPKPDDLTPVVPPKPVEASGTQEGEAEAPEIKEDHGVRYDEVSERFGAYNPSDSTYEPPGEMTIREYPLTERLSRPKPRKRKRQTAVLKGGLVGRLPRLITDEKVLMRKQNRRSTRREGCLLFDISGSMRLRPHHIEAVLRVAPQATVATYSGNGSTGTLSIVARRGKMCDPSALRGLREGGNVVDQPALEWLARQKGPRVWISDGYCTGQNDTMSNRIIHDCFAIARKAKVRRFGSIHSLLGSGDDDE